MLRPGVEEEPASHREPSPFGGPSNPIEIGSCKVSPEREPAGGHLEANSFADPIAEEAAEVVPPLPIELDRLPDVPPHRSISIELGNRDLHHAVTLQID